MVAAMALTIGCGKKGPPLPPLVRTPAAPADLTAHRRGATVNIRFSVPAANTDGSRPANVQQVDVYAFTGPSAVTGDQVISLGRQIASVQVKSPRDPDVTIDPDEPESDLDPLEGPGLDQGSAAQVSEALTAAVLASEGTPPSGALTRSYAGVSISTRGRRGPVSRRAAVPLVAAPPAPSPPLVSYDESRITLTWTLDGATAPTPGIPAAGPPGQEPAGLAYNVYEVQTAPPSNDGNKAGVGPEALLTERPVTDPQFVDPRIEWGARRCYTVRVVASVADLTVESDAPPSTCITLTDTFAPAAPSGVEAIASDGAISLLWDPSEAMDLAGYVVLRGPASGDLLTPTTPSPIAETFFRDVVPPGVRLAYAVQAVDKAGNLSPSSTRVEEMAR